VRTVLAEDVMQVRACLLCREITSFAWRGEGFPSSGRSCRAKGRAPGAAHRGLSLTLVATNT
jgi:hypothetical protein